MKTPVKIIARRERTAVGQPILRWEVSREGKLIGTYETRLQAREVARTIRKEEQDEKRSPSSES
jgi:hypothetical protein